MSLIVKIVFKLLIVILLIGGGMYMLLIDTSINNYLSLEKSSYSLSNNTVCPDRVYLPYKEMIRHGDSFTQVKQLLDILYEDKKISFFYINKNKNTILKATQQPSSFINSDLSGFSIDVNILISDSLYKTFKTVGMFSVFFNDDNIVDKLSKCTIMNSGI